MFDRSQAIIGHGKSLAWSDTENGTYTEIDGIDSITPPNPELSSADVTNDQSPSRTRQSIPGIFEPGTVDATYKYTPSVFEQVEEVFMLASEHETAADATKWWRVMLNNGDVFRFQGFIVRHSVTQIELEDAVAVELSIQVTGPVTHTADAGS